MVQSRFQSIVTSTESQILSTLKANNILISYLKSSKNSSKQKPAHHLKREKVIQKTRRETAVEKDAPADEFQEDRVDIQRK